MLSITRLLRTATLSLLVFPGLASAVTVDYFVQGDFTTSSPLTINGLTATAGVGQTMGLNVGSGLGVVGGSDPGLTYLIDTNESVLFQFVTGLATGVSFNESIAVNNGGDLLMNLEGLGAGMVSLGMIQYNIFSTFNLIDVSSAFGNVPLSGFRVSGNGTGSGVDVRSVSFTPTVTSVPEPTTLSLLAMGGVIVFGSRRRMH